MIFFKFITSTRFSLWDIAVIAISSFVAHNLNWWYAAPLLVVGVIGGIVFDHLGHKS